MEGPLQHGDLENGNGKLTLHITDCLTRPGKEEPTDGLY